MSFRTAATSSEADMPSDLTPTLLKLVFTTVGANDSQSLPGRREICAFLLSLVILWHMSHATKIVLGTIGISLLVGIIMVANLVLVA
jgi:hypothetical protein